MVLAATVTLLIKWIFIDE